MLVADDAPQERVCTKCGQSKALTKQFWIPCSTRQNKTGWQNYCRTCLNQRAAEYARRKRASNPDEARARAREYYREHREHILHHAKEWRNENIERIRERNRAYRERNRERIRIKTHEYRKSHMEYFRDKARRHRAKHPARHRARARQYQITHMPEVLVRNKRRRAREYNAPGQITKRDVDLQFRSQRGKCWYCLCDISQVYEIEHIVPLSRGGTNYANNVVLACPTCNRSKHDKLPHEWIGRLF